MPEMPEVETIRSALDQALRGARIERVDVRCARLRHPVPRNLDRGLRGCRLRSIRRRGKFLLIDLSCRNVLIVHFGMSGHARIEDGSALRKHDHAVFHTSRGRLIYHDPRRFGRIDCIPKSGLANYPPLAGMGFEPLSRQATAQGLYRVLHGRPGAIKSLLMDQRIIAGLGNIYACEALFASRVSPRHPGGDLTLDECRRLNRGIRSVLREAVAQGGSSLRDHIRPDGTPGYFQHAFRVYGRDGRPCRRCGSPIHRERIGGRATFSCPSCQSRAMLAP